MWLHLPAIPHTIASAAYSHCAFAGKVLRFPRMMMSVGYEVYHYGVEGSETVNIDLLSREEWEDLRRQSYAELYPDRGDEGARLRGRLGAHRHAALSRV